MFLCIILNTQNVKIKKQKQKQIPIKALNNLIACYNVFSDFPKLKSELELLYEDEQLRDL